MKKIIFKIFEKFEKNKIIKYKTAIFKNSLKLKNSVYNEFFEESFNNEDFEE